MSNNVTMRPLEDGSYSACYAAEENVGKGRCKHVATTSFNVQVEKAGPRLKEITVSNDYSKLDKRDKVEVVKVFLRSMKPITEDEAQSIIKELRGM